MSRGGDQGHAALPLQLHDAGLQDWFAEQVRTLVGDEAEDCVDGAWGGLGHGLSSEELDAVVNRMRRRDGAPERATLTMMAGWSAGYVAWMMASAMLRDGVLVAGIAAWSLERAAPTGGVVH